MSENRTKSLRFLLYVVTLRDSDFVRFLGGDASLDETKLQITSEFSRPLNCNPKMDEFAENVPYFACVSRIYS